MQLIAFRSLLVSATLVISEKQKMSNYVSHNMVENQEIPLSSLISILARNTKQPSRRYPTLINLPVKEDSSQNISRFLRKISILMKDATKKLSI